MSKFKSENNLSMLIDFYELTMSNGYIDHSIEDTICVFDMFFRKNPDKAGFSIFAGLEQVVEYIENLNFSNEDIEHLRNTDLFSEKFLQYLKNFKFTGDIWSVKEGTPVFPNTPIVVVKAPVIEAQLIETMVLLSVNHQSLITTKANRIVRAAKGKEVFELGSRRAQGYDAAVVGARSAYIGGCTATACVLAEQKYSVPAVGTMAHSWVQLFDSEYEAFKKYAETYPANCSLLIDTYNTLKLGINNAIKVFNEVVLPKGFRPKSVRIDSGDLAYVSKKVREKLDENGFEDVKIILSNSLDEHLIKGILQQGAEVDCFGVGENLITSKSDPVFGGVYKLVAVEKNNKLIPKIKISGTLEKINNPHFKMLYRVRDNETGKAFADYLTVFDENVENVSDITLSDVSATWNKKHYENITLEPMLNKIYENGKLVYDLPNIEEIRKYCAKEVALIPSEVRRFDYPHTYYVNLSEKLFKTKTDLLEEYSK